jgi:hypothetical protein
VNVYSPRQAYTLPVVVSVLQKVGPPALLKALPEPRQGRCVVTLAVVLSSITNLLLNEALTGVSAHRERQKPRGPDEEFQLSATVARIREERKNNFKRIAFLEIFVAGRALERPGTKEHDFLLLPREAGHPENLRAVQDVAQFIVTPPAFNFALWSSDYQAAVGLHAQLGDELDQAEKRLQEHRATLSNQAGEPPSAGEIKLQAASFYYGKEFLEVSPVANLVKHEFDWWQKFVGLLTRSINETLKTHPYKIALRDPHILQAIQKAKETGKYSPSGTWAHVLGNLAEFDRTASYPAMMAPMDDLVRKWKQRFEEEDRATEEWITKTGGPDHPHNIYNSVCQQYPDLFWMPLSEKPLKEDSEEVRVAKKEKLKARRAHRAEVLGKIPLQQLEARRQKEQFFMELFDALGGKIDHAFVKLFPVTRPGAVPHGDAL